MYQRNQVNVLVSLLFLIICQKTAFSQTIDEYPQELRNFMASREMRYHHFLWHNIRNQWYNFDSKTQQEITKLGWAPPRPAYTESGSIDKNNDSGEDFLYMHHKMIKEANKIMKKYSKSKKITGFKTIPAPGDKDYPVPRGGRNENYENWKNDEFYWSKIKPNEDKFNNPDYLRSVTLGRLGSQIEFSIHNYLHVRFSNTSSSRNRPSSSKVMPYIDKKWDDPNYDWLLDNYASHVHPLFWKIHGWVDDRIRDWKKANNITLIEWKGTWTGGPKSNISDLLNTTNNDSKSRNLQENHHGHKHNICVMEKLVRLLLKTEKCFFSSCLKK